jgi:hypothetical protein
MSVPGIENGAHLLGNSAINGVVPHAVVEGLPQNITIAS